MIVVKTIKRAIFGSYVPVILINSSINSTTTQNVRDCIERIDPKRADAVALLINSPGGSPVQCEIITNMLKGFTSKHHLPLYTFADDIAASGGQYLLSIGDKSFVHRSSLVGSVGVVSMQFGFRGILEDNLIKPESFHSSPQQIGAFCSVFDPLTPEGKQKVMRHLSAHHKVFKQHTEKYSRLKLNKEERDAKIFNAQIILGKDAVTYGLADEIGEYQEVIKRIYPKAKIEILEKKSYLKKAFEGVSFLVPASLHSILPLN